MVTSLVLGLVSGVALIIGVNEHRARQVYWDSVHSMVTVLKHLDEFGQARTILGEFKRTFPWTTVTKNAHALSVELEKLEIQSADKHRTREETLRYEARTQLQKLRIQCDEEKFSKASKILESIDITLLPKESRKEIEKFRAVIKEYMDTAQDYENRARKALQDGDFVKAHRLRKAILYRFSEAPVARNLRLPVRIKSTPPGVNLIVDGKIRGKTPMLLLLDPESTRNIVLARPGYKLLSLNRAIINGKLFRPIDMPVVGVTLAKEIKWSYQAGEPIECFPAAREDRVYVGTRSGVVYAVDRRSGAKVWEFEVDFKMDVTGGLGLWNNLLYFGSSNGLLYVLNAQTGALVRKIANATKDLQPITSAPSRITDRPITFVNCGSKSLSAVNISTGEVVWVKYFKQRRLVGQPLAVRDHVYVTTDTGTFLKISQLSGEIEKTIVISDPSLAHPGQVHGQRAYFFDGGHNVRALDIVTSSELWTYAVKDGITAPLTVDSDHVVVPTRSEIFCLSASGEPSWRVMVQDEITTQGTIFRDTYICGTRKGRVLCLDLASGTVLWSYKTQGRPPQGFFSRATIKEGYLYIGSEAGLLYSMAVE